MEECFVLLNSFNNLPLKDSYKILEDKTINTKLEILSKEFNKNEIIIDLYNLLVLYFIYYNPFTIELHNPILTYYKLINVNKFCVESLNSILQNNNDDWLKFEYYWKNYDLMLNEWIKKDLANIKYYMTMNILSNTKDDILFLTREETATYLLYENWIEKKYKDLYNKPNLRDDIINIFYKIYDTLILELFNENKIKYELENDDIIYIIKCFDLIIDTINIRLLDLYYINCKKIYLNNTCCSNITFVLMSLISIIFYCNNFSISNFIG
jgi:hypothetical protein